MVGATQEPRGHAEAGSGVESPRAYDWRPAAVYRRQSSMAQLLIPSGESPVGDQIQPFISDARRRGPVTEALPRH